MKPFKSLNLSDIHLGCLRLDPTLMVENLQHFLYPLIEKEKPDLIGIQGDVFDTSITYADKWSPSVIKFITGLLYLCEKYQTQLRVLRGTFSHDRTQPALFEVLHREMKLKHPFKYVDVISVEHIPEFDLTLGYIPDNVPYNSSDEVLLQLKTIMSTHGRDTLDYLYMHGSFDHTLPFAAQKHCKVLYRTDQFDFVKRFVITGHIHKHSIKDHVINNGSPVRLTFGEPEPKGCILIKDDGKEASISFIENTQTCQYKVYDFSSKDLEEKDLLEEIRKELREIPLRVECHVKILHPVAEVSIQLLTALRQEFPHIRFIRERPLVQASFHVEEEVVEEEDEIITPDTLPKVVSEMVGKKEESLTEQSVKKILEMVEK